MKTIAYLRVSKDSQDVGNQRLAILEFARQEKFGVSAFMELSVSSRRSPKERQIDLLMAQLEPSDTLVVSELSRMGRSVGEVITTVDALLKQQVRFLAIKEGIRLAGKQDLHSKVMVTLFGLFAEIERELISMRTKEGLAAARVNAWGVQRDNWDSQDSTARKTKFKGSWTSRSQRRRQLGQSRLNGKEDEIQRLLDLKVSKTSIAKITGVDRSTLYHFMRSRHLMPRGQ